MNVSSVCVFSSLAIFNFTGAKELFIWSRCNGFTLHLPYKVVRCLCAQHLFLDNLHCRTFVYCLLSMNYEEFTGVICISVYLASIQGVSNHSADKCRNSYRKAAFTERKQGFLWNASFISALKMPVFNPKMCNFGLEMPVSALKMKL